MLQSLPALTVQALLVGFLKLFAENRRDAGKVEDKLMGKVAKSKEKGLDSVTVVGACSTRIQSDA